MFIVALTGGIGCGKSEATQAFSKLGVPIVDLDTISHQLTAANQPLLNEITAKFGHSYVTEEGALNRKRMRKLAFEKESARLDLNDILHPAIYQEALKQLQGHADAAYTILAVPLLDKDSPYISAINRILVIDCDEETQIQRVKQRSQLNDIQIKKIIQAQMPRPARLAMADDLIENSGNIEELRQKINARHMEYSKACKVSQIIS
ncbi:MAG: dephospho-CoA kinase [Methylophilaceae bacterium]|jgi:dephospho-CoA kinase